MWEQRRLDDRKDRVMQDLLDVAEQLAAVLERENAALADLDLRRAAGMLAEKQQVAAAFVAAAPDGAAVPPELVHRLGELAKENQARLEQAMLVQRRVIGIIARAVRSTAPAPRYGATGAMAAARPMAFSLSARA
jgi:uncharacterized protein YPO0396